MQTFSSHSCPSWNVFLLVYTEDRCSLIKIVSRSWFRLWRPLLLPFCICMLKKLLVYHERFPLFSRSETSAAEKENWLYRIGLAHSIKGLQNMLCSLDLWKDRNMKWLVSLITVWCFVKNLHSLPFKDVACLSCFHYIQKIK